MNDDHVVVSCTCGQKNRVVVASKATPKCGRCRASLADIVRDFLDVAAIRWAVNHALPDELGPEIRELYREMGAHEEGFERLTSNEIADRARAAANKIFARKVKEGTSPLDAFKEMFSDLGAMSDAIRKPGKEKAN